MAKILVALLATVLCFSAAVSAQEDGCCADPELGCFTDDPPYAHLPLPTCDFEVVYVLFTPEDRDVGVEFQRDSIPPTFNSALPTVFIIHGYTNTRFEDWIAEMRLAFLDTADYNVIVVGWGEGADAPLWAYPRSASNTRIVGRDVALLTDLLVADHGAAHADMWCVGYSLGAHTCGHAGRESSQKLGRVTGLDPAGPEWEEYDIEAGINPSSAEFVDIIHTNGKGTVYVYGQLRPLGQVDFYPNEGGMQPGCLTLAGEEDGNIDDLDASCSHGRAVEFFTESIGNDCFRSCSVCDDEFDMPEDCTECAGCAIMGYGASPQTSGIYYLTTGSGSDNNPFCDGAC